MTYGTCLRNTFRDKSLTWPAITALQPCTQDVMPTFTGFSTCYGRWIWQKANSQQRKHFGGLHSAVSVWLKILCPYFSSPHKHWSDFSHIVASHCWVVESGAIFTMTGKGLGRPFTDTHDSACPIWFKAAYLAHFLNNEQQMPAKGISLPPPKS